MRKVLNLFLALLLLLSLVGCGKEGAAPKKQNAEKAKPAAKKEAKKETGEVKNVGPEQSEQYTYEAKGRRDPFLSLVETTKRKAVKKKGASPFESYDIDEIKLLAIAWDKNNKYYALIMLPDKKTYTITEGRTLGLQGGKVIKITKDSVIIREFVKDYRGVIRPRDSILRLHKGEE
jgi:type IV pilus assembly protein PilP